ncbi:ABC transporter permease subunit [Halorussus lipolyticus]|uniref:ABC transporter permease subunit n=1 Tax=Halorussus lipolyticus TaxID=3034024 RepID=UPI0023E84413|nr:ABC transporter permease subunit [Halorussus sp. DT80]
MTIGRVFGHELTVIRRTAVGKFLVALSLVGALGGTLVGYGLSNDPLTGDFLAFSLWLVAGTVLPFGALLTSAVAIAADRESGRLRLLFGTPVTRADVFVGTLLSRVAATCVSVGVGFALTVVVVSLFSVEATRGILRLATFTLLFCVVYTTVGTVISAISPTRLRAIGLALVFYVWSAMWPQIVGILVGPNRSPPGPPTSAERLTHFVGTLSPFGAYSQVVTPARAIYAESVAGSLLATPTMLLILVTWAVVPVPIGYWWLSRIDL